MGEILCFGWKTSGQILLLRNKCSSRSYCWGGLSQEKYWYRENVVLQVQFAEKVNCVVVYVGRILLHAGTDGRSSYLGAEVLGKRGQESGVWSF
jgi:hypothetical protein